jgi:hypothetical protein
VVCKKTYRIKKPLTCSQVKGFPLDIILTAKVVVYPALVVVAVLSLGRSLCIIL